MEFNAISFDTYQKQVKALEVYFRAIFPQLKIETLVNNTNNFCFKLSNYDRTIYFPVNLGYIELGNKKIALEEESGYPELLDLIAFYLNEVRPSSDRMRLVLKKENYPSNNKRIKKETFENPNESEIEFFEEIKIASDETIETIKILFREARKKSPVVKLEQEAPNFVNVFIKNENGGELDFTMASVWMAKTGDRIMKLSFSYTLKDSNGEEYSKLLSKYIKKEEIKTLPFINLIDEDALIEFIYGK